ncbi:MAG: HEAT repeat domain-containing protein [bacterium]
MIRCPLAECKRVLRIVFLCLVLINGALGSWAYVPFISLLEDADIVMVAKVIAIEQSETTKYAIADPQEILKGEWPTDSMLKLQVFEIPKSGVRIITDFPIPYDSAASYLLLLTDKDGRFDIIHYPEKTKIPLDENSNSLIADVKSILEIDTISTPAEQALRYTQLLGSPHQVIRESAAWKLGRIDCPEALTGLISALKDEDHWVLSNAIHGLELLARKGISSDQTVSSIENILRYTHYTPSLIEALAAQKGGDAIPYLHNFYSFNRDYKVRRKILIALNRLRDSTVVSLFHRIIYDDEVSYEIARLKITVLECLTKEDNIDEQYPDSIAFLFAFEALDYKNGKMDYYNIEPVQIEAIKLLESRTNKSFGDPENIRGFPDERKKERNKIISKWQKWYKNWLKKKNLGSQK